MSNHRIQIARCPRRQSTPSEDLLWQQLRGRRLEGLKFRRQTPIAAFIPDFCCYDLGLTIEIDGKHHLDQIEQDAARRTLIETHGFLELRFTNDEVKERLDWVIEEIRRAADIARARSPRDPFPRSR
ncbi:MAG: endonuclease domain-containing protein [Methylocella sp.]